MALRIGNSGDDQLTGTNAADLMFGRDGDDFIFGLGGGDVIAGGDDDDTIAGEGGDDQIDAVSDSQCHNVSSRAVLPPLQRRRKYRAWAAHGRLWWERSRDRGRSGTPSA